MKLRENEVLLFRGDSITDGIHPTITGLSLQKDNGSNALRKNGVNNLKGRSVYDDTEFNKRTEKLPMAEFSA